MSEVKIRGAIWRLKGKGRKYQGNQPYYRGKRHFVLTPIEGKGARKKFTSPRAAQNAGWRMK
jgi:hypothetical protein